MRQVVLDTETTGLEPSEGHRIIEIGAIELVGRRRTDRTFHCYLNPDREIDEGAVAVHGITADRLASSPRFADIAQQFIDFVRDAEVVIHNAPFDVGFLDMELRRIGKAWGSIKDYCQVVDSLAIARERHPGQRNNLDALCARYQVDNSARTLHGALLDAEILADVYLRMTGGQATLQLEVATSAQDAASAINAAPRNRHAGRTGLRVIAPTAQELEKHQARLRTIDSVSDGHCLWITPDPG